MIRSIIPQPNPKLDLLFERIADVSRESILDGMDYTRATQEMVYPRAMGNRRLRNRSSPRWFLSHRDALTGGTAIGERWLLPRTRRERKARLDQCPRARLPAMQSAGGDVLRYILLYRAHCA